MARLGRRFPVQPFRSAGTTTTAPPFDSFAITDSVVVDGRGLDSFSITDGITRQSFTCSDSVAVVDALVTIRDAVTASDTISGLFDAPHISASGIHVSDSLTISDRVTKGFARSSTDALTISDSVSWISNSTYPTDSISIADSPKPSSSPGHSSDSFSFLDLGIGTPGHNVQSTADSFSFSDIALGPTGHNTRVTSDAIALWDHTPQNGLDHVTFSDAVSVSLVFFGALDNFAISDATGVAVSTSLRVYQVATEAAIAITAQARAYQVGAEVSVIPTSRMRAYQVVLEVPIQGLWGQLWPNGRHQPRPNGHGQMWPRWSTKTGVQ